MAVGLVQDLTGRGEGAQRARPAQAQPAPGGQSFGDLVKTFARDVNDLQFQAGHAVDLMATGQATDVHQVMIAVEEAGIALDLMLEIRNRVLDGYQELIRMQV